MEGNPKFLDLEFVVVIVVVVAAVFVDYSTLRIACRLL